VCPVFLPRSTCLARRIKTQEPRVHRVVYIESATFRLVTHSDMAETTPDVWSERRAMAIHEAGHAVASLDLGWVVNYLSIDDAEGGNTNVAPGDDPEAQIRISLFGREAEEEYGRRAGRPAEPWRTPGAGSHDDWQLARAVAGDDLETSAALLREAESECKVALRKTSRWRRIETVAEELDRTGFLSQSRLEELCPVEPWP
jgi:hypothetical protein